MTTNNVDFSVENSENQLGAYFSRKAKLGEEIMNLMTGNLHLKNHYIHYVQKSFGILHSVIPKMPLLDAGTGFNENMRCFKTFAVKISRGIKKSCKLNSLKVVINFINLPENEISRFINFINHQPITSKKRG